MQCPPFPQPMNFKSCFFYGFWFVLTILLAYWFSYPLDILSRHHYFGATDPTVGLWILNWQLSQLSSGNLDQLFTGNSFYTLVLSQQILIPRRVQKNQGKALSVRLIRSVPSWLVESFKAFSRCRRDLIGSPLVCMSKFPRL